MRQVGRIQDDSATRPVLVSDDVKEVRRANPDSDAKMEHLVSESVSKERAIFFAAITPSSVGINELICNGILTYAPPA